ncbi:hypothetical protein IMZ48_21370 [Candidatus Bathyarchaeota archaeon]|nr:hypothetical protein [Candidatus Bathyarchaeota archaeon]
MLRYRYQAAETTVPPRQVPSPGSSVGMLQLAVRRPMQPLVLIGGTGRGAGGEERLLREGRRGISESIRDKQLWHLCY